MQATFWVIELFAEASCMPVDYPAQQCSATGCIQVMPPSRQLRTLCMLSWHIKHRPGQHSSVVRTDCANCLYAALRLAGPSSTAMASCLPSLNWPLSTVCWSTWTASLTSRTSQQLLTRSVLQQLALVSGLDALVPCKLSAACTWWWFTRLGRIQQACCQASLYLPYSLETWANTYMLD